MEAKELRIGNLIQDKKYKCSWRIECFLGSTMATVDTAIVTFPTDDNHDIELNNIDPIPLTEEWLLKFGFMIIDPEPDYYEMALVIERDGKKVNILSVANDSGYEYHEDGVWYFQREIETNGFYDEDKTELKYVHQLQNLYFALTGKELVINS